MYRWLFAFSIVALPVLLHAALAPAQQVAEQGERKIALVIGNAAYPGAPLRNPVNDARAMAAKLKQLGFEVTLRENAAHRDMARALGSFGAALANGGAGLFYYAGHGMQVHGRNFLIPVDAEINSESSVLVEAIEADSVLEQMATAGNRLNVAIFDACRNNPFERRFRGQSGGLAQTEAPTGTLIAYATAPGKVASDGDGTNGLYTSELLLALDQPGLRIEDVFKRVRVRVAAATSNQQVPWEASSLTGDFYFNPLSETPAIGSSDRGGDVALELAFWESIKGSHDPADFHAYLERFPQGTFVPLARNRLAALSGGQQTLSAQPPPPAAPDEETQRQKNPEATTPTPASTTQQAAVPIELGTTLAGEQIRSMIIGNSISGVEQKHPDAVGVWLRGEPFTELYLSNGVIKGQQYFLYGKRHRKYGGAWNISGDRFCLDYQGTSHDGCWTLSLNGGTLHFTGVDGTSDYENPATLQVGNPAGL